jgi:hypothetical protein
MIIIFVLSIMTQFTDKYRALIDNSVPQKRVVSPARTPIFTMYLAAD